MKKLDFKIQTWLLAIGVALTFILRFYGVGFFLALCMIIPYQIVIGILRQFLIQRYTVLVRSLMLGLWCVAAASIVIQYTHEYSFELSFIVVLVFIFGNYLLTALDKYYSNQVTNKGNFLTHIQF